MKQILAIITIIGFMLQSSLAAQQDVSIKDFSALEFYLLVDPDNGEILLSKNDNKHVAPSSMTKLMTAYVIFDQIQKGQLTMQNKCLVGKDAWRKRGSTMFLNYGDVVTIEDLIKGLLVVSGNDAAVALAESSVGGIDKFVDLMNLKALELGMIDSHFKNPHGLHEKGHYMTLHDLATLMTKIYQNFPQYVKYLGIKEFTYHNITQRNRNPLIKKNYDGIIGGKTGHTNQGGYGVVAMVKRDHRRLVAVINKARSSKLRSESIIKLFDYGFRKYKKLILFEKNQVVSSLKIWLGKKTRVNLISAKDISLNLDYNKSLNEVNAFVKYLAPIHAPVLKNTQIANLVIEVDGKKIASYPLFAQNNIAKAGYFARVGQILRYKLANFYNQNF